MTSTSHRLPTSISAAAHPSHLFHLASRFSATYHVWSAINYKSRMQFNERIDSNILWDVSQDTANFDWRLFNGAQFVTHFSSEYQLQRNLMNSKRVVRVTYAEKELKSHTQRLQFFVHYDWYVHQMWQVQYANIKIWLHTFQTILPINTKRSQHYKEILDMYDEMCCHRCISTIRNRNYTKILM
jgi:hypothetical protein